MPVSLNILADNNPICIGDNVNFNATATNGGTTPDYQWQINGSDVGTNSSTFASTTINSGDFVSCILTSSEACVTSNPATSNNIVMTVEDVPSSGFTVNTLDLIADFTNTSVDATSYMWLFGDGNSTNQPSPSHTYLTEGLYTVTLIAFNACGSDTITIDVNMILDDIDDLSRLNSINIYPNPTTGDLNIEFENYNNSDVNIAIYNLLGEILESKIIEDTFGKYKETLDMSKYQQGVYLLKVNSNGKQRIEKIILR